MRFCPEPRKPVLNAKLPPSLQEPIAAEQQRQVVAATKKYIALAGQLYDQCFEAIPVLFDLRGRAAGMYVVSGRGRKLERKIRYNPWLFAKYFEDNLRDTVPHEVAHYVVEQLYGRGTRRNRVLPHGAEWRSVMAAFGADNSVTTNFDLTGIPQRQQRTVSYRCDCREHQLGIRRHNKVVRSNARYLCRYCGSALTVDG